MVAREGLGSMRGLFQSAGKFDQCLRDAGMECTHIVPLDRTHVLFAISRRAEDFALSMNPVTDIYVVDISLQQRVQRIFALGADADVCFGRTIVPRGPCHDFKQFLVRSDGRVLALWPA